jgi:hypothetical protein
MQVGAPSERAGIDLTGPWPKSNNNVYILTYVDHFTKWADAVPLPNKEAVTVATALVTKIFAQVGTTLQLLSDQGREFDNNLMAALCNLLGIDKVRTTSYKASTNGAVERMHRTLNALLAKSVEDNQRNWSAVLPHVMAAYRSAVHESTGYSPNCLHFGREVWAPLDVMLQPPPTPCSVDDFVDRTQHDMHYAYNLARTQLGSQAERRKQYYDMNVREKKFQVNDWVWYFYPRRRNGRSPKWQRLYTGPYLIVDQIGPVNFIIKKSAKADPLVVHKLKLCESETPTSWLEPVATMAGSNAVEVDGWTICLSFYRFSFSNFVKKNIYQKKNFPPFPSFFSKTNRKHSYFFFRP